VCVCLFIFLSLTSTPGSFVHCVLLVQLYVWVWPGVGYGVSGEFSRYFSTRGWGRLKAKSPFDTSSPIHSAFAHVSISFGFLTGLSRYFVLGSDLFLWSDVGLFFLRRWIWTWLVLLGFVDINCHYATQSRGRSWSRYCDPWMGCSLRLKLITLDFRQRTREKMGKLGGNHNSSESLCHKPLIWSGGRAASWLFLALTSTLHSQPARVHTDFFHYDFKFAKQNLSAPKKENPCA